MLELGLYGVRDVARLRIFYGNIVTNFASATPLMNFDYANTVTEESTADRVYAMGAGQRRLAWDGNKERTLAVETQLFTMQHLALMSGETIKKKAKDIIRVDSLTVQEDGTVTLTKTPINDDIAVLPFVNGMIKRLPQTVTDVNGEVVTLRMTETNDVKAGDQVEVYYKFNVTDAYTLPFTDETNPPYVTIVADTFYQDEQSKAYIPAQIVYYSAKLRQESTFSYSSEGDPTSLTLTFDLFPQKINGKSTTHEIIIYDDPDSIAQNYKDVEYEN